MKYHLIIELTGCMLLAGNAVAALTVLLLVFDTNCFKPVAFKLFPVMIGKILPAFFLVMFNGSCFCGGR